MKLTTNPQPVVDQIMQWNRTDISNVLAFRHGKAFEPQARSFYLSLCGENVEERGLMLHPEHPWLGASIDGFISSKVPRCVEIKYPLIGPKDPVH